MGGWGGPHAEEPARPWAEQSTEQRAPGRPPTQYTAADGPAPGRPPAPLQAYEKSKSVKGRAQAAVYSAVIFLACRQTGYPRTFKEICASVPQAAKKVQQLLGPPPGQPPGVGCGGSIGGQLPPEEALGWFLGGAGGAEAERAAAVLEKWVGGPAGVLGGGQRGSQVPAAAPPEPGRRQKPVALTFTCSAPLLSALGRTLGACTRRSWPTCSSRRRATSRARWAGGQAGQRWEERWRARGGCPCGLEGRSMLPPLPCHAAKMPRSAHCACSAPRTVHPEAKPCAAPRAAAQVVSIHPENILRRHMSTLGFNNEDMKAAIALANAAVPQASTCSAPLGTIPSAAPPAPHHRSLSPLQPLRHWRRSAASLSLLAVAFHAPPPAGLCASASNMHRPGAQAVHAEPDGSCCAALRCAAPCRRGRPATSCGPGTARAPSPVPGPSSTSSPSSPAAARWGAAPAQRVLRSTGVRPMLGSALCFPAGRRQEPGNGAPQACAPTRPEEPTPLTLRRPALPLPLPLLPPRSGRR